MRNKCLRDINRNFYLGTHNYFVSLKFVLGIRTFYSNIVVLLEFCELHKMDNIFYL